MEIRFYKESGTEIIFYKMIS